MANAVAQTLSSEQLPKFNILSTFPALIRRLWVFSETKFSNFSATEFATYFLLTKTCIV